MPPQAAVNPGIGGPRIVLEHQRLLEVQRVNLLLLKTGYITVIFLKSVFQLIQVC